MSIKITRIQTHYWGCCPKALTVQALATLGLGGERMWVKKPTGKRNKVEEFAS